MVSVRYMGSHVKRHAGLAESGQDANKPTMGPMETLLSSLKNINPGGLAVIRSLSVRYPSAPKSWCFVSTVCKFLPKAALPSRRFATFETCVLCERGAHF